MAQLIQLRQRIRAIETIKKITHAMRLISMSTHTRLKGKEEPLTFYKQTVSGLFSKMYRLAPEWKHALLTPKGPEKILILLIGSQKGLCGSFNTALFHFFEKYRKEHKLPTSDVICVGKRTITYAKESKIGTIIAAFDEITTKNISKIAHTISDIVINPQNSYTKVLIFSNILKTFFLQRPQVFTLIPLEPFDIQETQFPEIILEDYMWEQKVDEILDILVKQYIDANLQYLLFESLLAEHAARFISMDNSTRNAQNLLETTKLDYNKLRQAKITKELAELIGSFE